MSSMLKPQTLLTEVLIKGDINKHSSVFMNWKAL